ncbi:MAG: hypothetical protein M1832_005753 [Thelocarpon impressellum]|nr:MAG: hypothetical protein M1832_005753 [Thelocarpon impressellum]
MQVIPGPYPLFSQNGYQQRPLRVRLPTYVRPLPARVAPEDEEYLWKKGALAVPAIQLRNELLQAYLDYVHPYMPLLDWQQFVRAVEGNGAEGQTSLLLLQAVMFAGSPYVDMRSLRSAGFTTRKAARKALFQKAKLLYDVDYEIDRITLVQSLLLMTYWYETPDDQKDTWHWMGVAISLAYSIGLNRNPEGSNMNVARKQLWRRIWWSCFVRERLVALAMRRPTRIRAEDYDVPILTLSDFTVEALPENISCISSDCFMARDLDMQRQLAVLCVEEAKLSLCISHVLSTQYSILINNQGVTTTEGNTLTTMILLPKKPESEACNLGACDLELSKWYQGLPEEAAYRSPAQAGIRKRPLFVHRALLHMLYHTTVSALHRPQLLPCGPTIGHAHGIESAVQDTRRKVHASATEITRIARELNECDLVQFLPSTGVTVLLPAIVNHLLIMKTSDGETREASLQGFCDCMRAMRRLSASYAAADYATEFLEAATKKAGIQFAAPGSADVGRKHRVTDLSDLLDVGMRRSSVASSSQLTPPPEQRTGSGANPTASGSFSERRDSLSSGSGVGYTGLAQKLTSFLAYTPPSSDLYDGDSRSRSSASVTPLTSGSGTSGLGSGVAFDWPDATPGIFCDVDADLGDDFESLVDLDGAAGSFFGDGDEAGNAGDFTSDMDWMAEMGEGSKEHGRTGMSVGM